MAHEPVIERLREQINRIQGGERRDRGSLAFGVQELDERLPAKGLELGALHEVAGGGNGVIDGAAAALFVAGIAARTIGKVLWCLMRPDLFASVPAQAGLAADRVIFVEAATTRPCWPERMMGFAMAAGAPSSARSRA